MAYRCTRELGGRVLTIETGKVAGNADGAVTVHYGDSVVLVTACMSPEPRTGIDFFPLTVDYEERLYAAGKIPGGFIKREGRPTQDAVLAGRLTDRTIRPLFPKGLHNDVQVIITVLSADQENDPDVLAITGASAALGISTIPFGGLVAAVRVGLRGGQFFINPTFSDLQDSLLDLVVASSPDAVVMVEAGAKEVPESTVLEAIKFGHQANQELIALQRELIAAAGKPKVEVQEVGMEAGVAEAIAHRIKGSMADAVSGLSKAEREEELAAFSEELVERLADEFSEADIKAVFQQELKREMRRKILEDNQRPDGRAASEIRPIWCEVGILPRTHGSGLFTRGQTQVLSIVTLGSLAQEQKLDSLSPEERRRFMHHYNFPPFSTGEVRRLGGVGRREIGHGALAERAILAVIPEEERFPYTIRIVSEVLSSNGSTSMGSVCGSSLALMDAGVPITAPVAGVAMGLIMGEDGRFAVLTDIAGMEDAMGDMDFKVAGTAAGVNALQMDIKIKGLPFPVMEEALAQARTGRLFILGKMLETITESRSELSQFAPRMTRITIDPDKIRFLIGPGGKTIRSITEETKTSIDVENDGSVVIGSTNPEMTQKAIRMIEALTKDVEVGAVYTGKVTRTMNFGAFVEIAPGKEGLVHISELADYRVPSVEAEVQVGDEVMVMVTEIDRMGRINLSRRAVLQGEGEQAEEGEPRPAPAPAPRGYSGPPRRQEGPRPGGPRGGGGGGGPRGNGRPGGGGRPPGGPRGGDRRPGGPMRG
ncbi:MAG: polyribonucleotide nucleotidyltransferase [Chloroflexi bacterium]|nr:polyribonucleotide nucleotidyltransferase [Chloroflexota bacterium]